MRKHSTQKQVSVVTTVKQWNDTKLIMQVVLLVMTSVHIHDSIITHTYDLKRG